MYSHFVTQMLTVQVYNSDGHTNTFSITSSIIAQHITECHSDADFERMCLNGIPVQHNDIVSKLDRQLDDINRKLGSPSPEIMELQMKVSDLANKFSSKSSHAIGQVGESNFNDRLTNELHLPWEDKSKCPHAGDVHVHLTNGETLLVDVKSYTKAVPSEEIKKTHRDLKQLGLKFGMMYSLRSPISTTRNFELVQCGDGVYVFCVQDVAPTCLKIAIDMITSISSILNNERSYNTGYAIDDINKFITDINAITKRFANQRESLVNMRAILDKHISDMMDNVRLFELDMHSIVDKFHNDCVPHSYQDDDTHDINNILLEVGDNPMLNELEWICNSCITDGYTLTKPLKAAKCIVIDIKKSNVNKAHIEVYKSKINISVSSAKFIVDAKSTWGNSRVGIMSYLNSV